MCFVFNIEGDNVCLHSARRFSALIAVANDHVVVEPGRRACVLPLCHIQVPGMRYPNMRNFLNKDALSEGGYATKRSKNPHKPTARRIPHASRAKPKTRIQTNRNETKPNRTELKPNQTIQIQTKLKQHQPKTNEPARSRRWAAIAARHVTLDLTHSVSQLPHPRRPHPNPHPRPPHAARTGASPVTAVAVDITVNITGDMPVDITVDTGVDVADRPSWNSVHHIAVADDVGVGVGWRWFRVSLGDEALEHRHSVVHVLSVPRHAKRRHLPEPDAVSHQTGGGVVRKGQTAGACTNSVLYIIGSATRNTYSGGMLKTLL